MPFKDANRIANNSPPKGICSWVYKIFSCSTQIRFMVVIGVQRPTFDICQVKLRVLVICTRNFNQSVSVFMGSLDFSLS